MPAETPLPQIVATVGPASSDPKTLEAMIAAGMGLARLNFSWGTHESHAEYIHNIRQGAKALGKRVPIVQDLSGPRLQEEEGHRFDQAAVQALTEKDIADVRFGVSSHVDYIAMSYVGSAADVTRLRDTIQSLGAEIPIIAKIERQEAINNLDEIIAAADGIMVARGDLGSALPLHTIPFIQKLIIRKANGAGKPVITATQMLLSMVKSAEPTRAEVNDVANAILDGSDAVMLSEESARGAHPIEAVTIMHKIITEARHYIYRQVNPL